MTWGHYARDPEWGVPEGVRARSAKGVAPAGPTAAQRPGASHVQAILDLQRNAGNAAVTRLLRTSALAAPVAAVQRQDEEYAEGGQSWGTDEEAVSSSYSSSDSGGWETYGPPPPPEWGEEGGQSYASGEEAPGEAAPTDGGGGSEWSGGGGGGGSGGGEAAPAEDTPSTGGSGEGGGSSWWPFGGEETPRNEPGESAPSGDDGGGSSWWPFGGGGGEEAPSGDDGGGSSWWPFGGEDTPRNEPGEEEPGDRSEEDVDRKMEEGESGSEKDEFVPMGGGPNPIAKTDPISAAKPGGFHDDGNVGTVPVGSRADDDPAEAMNPRAFIRGGQTGTVAWAGGGGEGLGPKGNQGSGSLQSEIEPEYDYHWGGPATNASSFVVGSTGVVDVHRSYVSSKPGDQGNGWWVSEAAANALTAHEQKHVARARDVYDRTLEPMTVKIANSATYGKEKAYLGSNAKAALKMHIDWANTLKKFKSEDQAENAPNNRVDNEDVGAPHYPVPMKDPRTIEGKQYEHWEVMGGEKPPP